MSTIDFLERLGFKIGSQNKPEPTKKSSQIFISQCNMQVADIDDIHEKDKEDYYKAISQAFLNDDSAIDHLRNINKKRVLESEPGSEQRTRRQRTDNRRRQEEEESDEEEEEEKSPVNFEDRFPNTPEPYKPQTIHLHANTFYLNNRLKFIEQVNKMMGKYEPTENDPNGVRLKDHQQLVREYLNMYTPYRGILLYHGLGAGKTCASIAIAEGMKSGKEIVVMTKASLRENFYKDLEICGEPIYKRQQYWKFFTKEEIEQKTGKPLDETLKRIYLTNDDNTAKNGFWLMDITKKRPNYDSLEPKQRKEIDAQLKKMIESKYTHMNYNGLSIENYKKKYQRDSSKNIFDNKVIIIDEIHNLVQSIFNRINQENNTKDKIDKWSSCNISNTEDSKIALRLYRDIMAAKNAKLVFLTGTPYINNPAELSVLFNMLYGYICVFKIKITERPTEYTTDDFKNMLLKGSNKLFDYIDYKNDELSIIRNPFGFVNVYSKDSIDDYKGMKFDIETGHISDEAFINNVLSILQSKKNGVKCKLITSSSSNRKQPDDKNIPSCQCLTLFPDVNEKFSSYYLSNDISKPGFKIESGVDYKTIFRQRILGMVSYFKMSDKSDGDRSDDDNTNKDTYPEFHPELPYIEVLNGKINSSSQKELDKSGSAGSPYRIYLERVTMSKLQLEKYAVERVAEIKLDSRKRTKKPNLNDVLEESSSFRANSRALCNFVFPDTIERPRAAKSGEVAKESDSTLEEEPAETKYSKEEALQKIREHIAKLDSSTNNNNMNDLMEALCPKWRRIIKNIGDENHEGCHLLYSQWLTLEGLGIFKEIIKSKQLGYFELRLVKESQQQYRIHPDDMKNAQFIAATGKRFLQFTGEDDSELKEIRRQIFNSQWESSNGRAGLKEKHPLLYEDLIRLAKDSKVSDQNKNFYGEIVKVFMITEAGVEGIDLKNTRYVHIMEPYWHSVQIDQIIGRARRLNSHVDLPKDKQNVTVFVYMSEINHIGKDDYSENVRNIILSDKSIDPKKPNANDITVSSDEYLWEVSEIKRETMKHVLPILQSVAIDCTKHNTGKATKENKCFIIKGAHSSIFAHQPNYSEDISVVSEKPKEAAKEVQWILKLPIGKVFANIKKELEGKPESQERLNYYKAKLDENSEGKLEFYIGEDQMNLFKENQKKTPKEKTELTFYDTKNHLLELFRAKL